MVVDDAVDGVGGALVGHPEEALAVDNARNNLDELQEGRARQECIRARWNKWSARWLRLHMWACVALAQPRQATHGLT